MPITFDSALGIHQKALALRSQRAEVLASNIANADTPGYKAREIDFKAALADANMKSSDAKFNGSLARTHPKHISINTAANTGEVLYRVPNQPSLDGNTVDGLIEKTAFAENALHYQASLTFLDGKFKGMMAALKGE
jgi:flagellar basal-body rod protein FlgB